jgi:serine/threonine protein phosphatase PrpC
VADGVGGYVNGQETSRLAIETIVDSVPPQIRERQRNGTSWSELLRNGVKRANVVVYQRNQQLAGSSMGTTVTTALIVGPEVFVANIGDSRTYLYRPGQGLAQLTHGHSIVARLVEMGAITRDEISTHPRRNEIYRSLGTTLSVEVDGFRETLQDGAALLFCLDGLWEMVPDEQQLADVLSSSLASAGDMARRLVQLALVAGGLDNIGLVIVRVRIEDISGLRTIIMPHKGILLSA